MTRFFAGFVLSNGEDRVAVRPPRLTSFYKIVERTRPNMASHDYKRHGKTTLLAAFEVAICKVRVAHKKRRRKEFIDFMDEIVVR